MSLALLLAAGTATAVGTAALITARGLRRQIAGLRGELAAATAPAVMTGAAEGRGGGDGLASGEAREAATVPPARATPAAEIRAAVADALAEERERELAEARAFWAAQEARDTAGAADAHSLFGGLHGLGDDSGLEGLTYVPRQADLVGLDHSPSYGEPHTPDAMVSAEGYDPMADLDMDIEVEVDVDVDAGPDPESEAAESPELAAARRRHPSHPDFTPTAHLADHERTVTRLTELADAGTPLADVRPGPLGTLDVYVFADGTTICMTPGHRETSERLADALREGTAPVLLGGSGVSGAYALTFGCGPESVYVLADRVIASL